MTRIGSRPSVRLAHHLRKELRVGGRTEHYAVHPVPVDRADQPRDVVVTCGTCDTDLTLTVFDVARTKRLRVRWLAVAAIGLALCLPVVVSVVASTGTWLDDLPLVVPGVLITFVGVVLLRLEDGVRIHGEYFFQFAGSRTHSLMPASTASS